MDGAELDSIMDYLDRHEIPFKGTFQKVVNAGKRLRYGTSEPQVRSIPFFGFSGKTDYWNTKVQEDIYIKSQIGRYRIRGYGGARALPHMADLAFRKKITPETIDPNVVDQVEMYTEIGGINGAEPLKLSMPVMVAPMSYGALSASTKRAIGMASTLSRIAENTGEGGMSDAQRGAAEQLIFQCLGGRLGWNIHDMKRADGLEIYISQGAKPGLGGQLMAKKVTPELAAIRGIPPRHRPALAVAPSRHPRRRRSRHQGRGVPRGDRLSPPRLRQARRRARARRHQDRHQGRASTSSSSTACRARPARARPRGAGICRHPDLGRHHRSDRTRSKRSRRATGYNSS